MPLPVTILETAASYRRGLAPALAAAGFDIDAAPDAPGRRLVLAPLRVPNDCAAIDRMVDDGDLVVVALIPSEDPGAFSHALLHGVDGVVPWDADPDRIAAAARAATSGWVVLERHIAVSLARRSPDPHRDRPLLDATEVSWIVELARGATVHQLADRSGYSERAMFRRLGEVYARLGAANRAEALVAAERFGLLEPGG